MSDKWLHVQREETRAKGAARRAEQAAQVERRAQKVKQDGWQRRSL